MLRKHLLCWVVNSGGGGGGGGLLDFVKHSIWDQRQAGLYDENCCILHHMCVRVHRLIITGDLASNLSLYRYFKLAVTLHFNNLYSTFSYSEWVSERVAILSHQPASIMLTCSGVQNTQGQSYFAICLRSIEQLYSKLRERYYKFSCTTAQYDF